MRMTASTCDQEFRLAEISFRPWFEYENPPERTNWSITIEFLDRKSFTDRWLERQYRATIRDAADQIVYQATSPKPEGGLVSDAMESLCRQLGKWWVVPGRGPYSVDWLCGYFAGIRSRC